MSCGGEDDFIPLILMSGILSHRSFSFGPSGPSTERCLAELRWCVRDIAVRIFLVLLADREEETIAACAVDTVSLLFVTDRDRPVEQLV